MNTLGSRLLTWTGVSLGLLAAAGCGETGALTDIPVSSPDVALDTGVVGDDTGVVGDDTGTVADGTVATSDETSVADGTVPDAEVVEHHVTGAAGMSVNVLDPTTKLAVSLRVTDEQRRAVPNAEVVVGGASFPVTGTTAALTGISVSASPTITVRAPGYGSVSLVLDPTRALAGVSVMLRAYEATTTFATVLGGSLAFGGSKVTIAAGGVVGPNGQPYTGSVTVSALATDLERDLLGPIGGPTAAAVAKLPDPIVLVADGDGANAPKATMLKLASIVTELKGAAGETLQPAPGKPAEVQFKLSSTLATYMPTAYQAGAKLDVASRDDATGKWSTSGQCTVAGGPTGWTCTASLPHFSEAAVVQTNTQGCLVVGSIDLTVAEGEAVVWRQQSLMAPFNIPLKAHFFDNAGQLGMCAIVPLSLGTTDLVIRYQTAPVGTPVRAKPSFAAGTSRVTKHFSPGYPSDQNLAAKTDLDTSSAEGCLQACGAAPKLTVALTRAPSQSGGGEPTPMPPPPEPTPLPVVDLATVDLDQDGASALVDCDDSDPTRSPSFTDVCADGIDQNCNGKDALCPITCFEAGVACGGTCQFHPSTPEQRACVAACVTEAPFTSEYEAQAWSALQGCIGGCPDDECVNATCQVALAACLGGAPCAVVAPCLMGCKPLLQLRTPDAYNACVGACPPAAGDQSPLIDDILSCVAPDCDAGLTCAATAESPVSTCGGEDLGCYAGVPECTAAFAACFNP